MNVILHTLKCFSGSTQPAQPASGGLFVAPQPATSTGVLTGGFRAASTGLLFQANSDSDSDSGINIVPIQGKDTMKSGVQMNMEFNDPLGKPFENRFF